MSKLPGAQFVLALAVLWQTIASASNLDTVGVTLLWTVTTNLNGTGIRVGQAEGGAPYWEVNPGSSGVGQPTNRFTYFSSTSPYTSVSTANTFTNSLGLESGHADYVGGIFYGMSGGTATNVTHVDNYEAATLYYYYVNQSRSIAARVVNQSFIFCNADYSHLPVSTEQQINQQYDNYAAQYKILFVSGAGNGGPTNQARIYPPASCYNGIGVAAYGGGSCTGPTLDNGRAKPDITAPAAETSYSTPQVAGAAAVIEQAGLRGDGGSDTNSAADIRTVKALLLNGAIKPGNWTNGPASPLDARYGAGVLNVFNSYKQLAGGRHGYTVSNSVSIGERHPPTGASGAVSTLSGWDFNTNTSSSKSEGVNHYYFNVTNGDSNATFTTTATLVWNRQRNQTAINNLNLYLYNAANSNLVAVSTSAVDNVEHLFVPNLAQGRYDLQVWKAGGSFVSSSETYALAFEFFSLPLAIARSGSNVVFTWPIYPAGFVLQAATNLAAPVWHTNNPAPAVTNNQNCVTRGVTNGSQFFRLWRP